MNVYFRGKYHIDCKKTSRRVTCNYCGDTVIYWECYCGCKVYFNPYDEANGPYGHESDHKNTCPFYPR